MPPEPKTPASISVTYPNNGEQFPLPFFDNITWTSKNLEGNVKIDLINGTTVLPITSAAANDGSYPLVILEPFGIDSNYKIRICSTLDSTVCDESDTTFSLVKQQVPTPPTIQSVQVLSPNGGEYLTPGYIHTIQWAYNETDTAAFDISLWKGDAFYKWLVPDSRFCYQGVLFVNQFTGFSCCVN